MKQYLAQFFKSKTAASWIALVFAVVSAASAVVYTVLIGGSETLGTYYSTSVIGFLYGAAGAYIVFFVLQQDKLGAACMAGLNFCALIAFVLTIYPYPVGMGMDLEGFMTSVELKNMIICAAMMIVGAVAGNVLAWTRMHKKNLDGGNK